MIHRALLVAGLAAVCLSATVSHASGMCSLIGSMSSMGGGGMPNLPSIPGLGNLKGMMSGMVMNNPQLLKCVPSSVIEKQIAGMSDKQLRAMAAKNGNNPAVEKVIMSKLSPKTRARVTRIGMDALTGDQLFAKAMKMSPAEAKSMMGSTSPEMQQAMAKKLKPEQMEKLAAKFGGLAGGGAASGSGGAIAEGKGTGASSSFNGSGVHKRFNVRSEASRGSKSFGLAGRYDDIQPTGQEKTNAQGETWRQVKFGSGKNAKTAWIRDDGFQLKGEGAPANGEAVGGVNGIKPAKTAGKEAPAAGGPGKRECAQNLDQFKKSSLLTEAMGANADPWKGYKGPIDAVKIVHENGQFVAIAPAAFGPPKTPLGDRICINGKGQKPYIAMGDTGGGKPFADPAGKSITLSNDKGQSGSFKAIQ